MANMEITVYAKKRHTNEGKVFFTYLTTLTKKTGEKITAEVKFKESCEQFKADFCPCNITFERSKANFTCKTIPVKTTGETIISNVLWLSEWSMGSEYIDHSMDEFI